MERTELHARFRDLRQAAGLTKTDVARPRYTVSYVSQIEAGRRSPSPEAMAFFARRLGVAPEYLATGIPDGVEEALSYQLEGARRALRERDAEQALAILPAVRVQSERFGLRRQHAQALALSGEAQLAAGRMREAIDLFEEALEGDLPEREAGMTVASLGRAYRTVGDLSWAGEVVESYLRKERSAPLDPSAVAELQTVLVSVYFERGDIVKAEKAAQRALLAADLDVPPDVRARTYWDASRVLAEAKRWDEALELATRARLLMEELADRQRVARLHNAQAFLCLEAEPPRIVEAADHLDRAEELLGEGATPVDMAYVLTERSRLALLEERHQDAIDLAERAVGFVGVDEAEVARSLFLKGRALGALERAEEAREVLREAAVRFEKVGARQQQASCWREMGELDAASGDLEGAVDSFRAGLEALDPRRSRA